MIDREHVTQALVDLFRAELSNPVGDGEIPPDLDESSYPFLVVYSIVGGGYIGSLDDQHEDAQLVYQLSAGGRRRDQADWLLDRARGILLGRTAGSFTHTIQDSAGQLVIHRESDGGPGGIDVSGRPPTRLFTAVERFKLTVSP